MNPTVALPDLDTANKLRPQPLPECTLGYECDDTTCDHDVTHEPPVWPGWPVDTLPTIETGRPANDRPGHPPGRRPVRAGDRVTFTVPCDECGGSGIVIIDYGGGEDGWDEDNCQACDDGVVSVFSAVIDPVPVFPEGRRLPEAWMRHVAPAKGYGDWCVWEGANYDVPEVASTGRPPWKITPLPADLPITESTRFVLMVRADTIEDA